MPDIAMCNHDKCKSAHKCFRSESSGTRPLDRAQAYTLFGGQSFDAPAPEIDKCKDFVPARGPRP